MEKKHEEGLILDNYHKLVNDAITLEKIPSWQETRFIIGGNNGLRWHLIVCQGAPIKIDSIRNSEDLSALSNELQFIVGQMYVYRIHIRDSSLSPSYGAESLFYPKEVNYAESMYNMLVNQAYQSCYNFWDRIADLINPFLPKPLDARAVDFTRVIAAIPSSFQTQNYLWLMNYCENEYKALNDARKTIVHYEIPSTAEIFNHLNVITNKVAIKKLHTDKLSKADYFKQKCAEQLQGLIYCFSFLDDVNTINGVPPNPSRESIKVS